MAKIIYDTSEETRLRELTRLREKALHDEASAIMQAWEEGIVEGLVQSLGITEDFAKEIAKDIVIDKKRGFEKVKKEGGVEERKAIIEKMRAMGCSENLINAIFPSN